MADNKIANAIKFLKGEEKSLPAAKTEGQVYFAYKNVGTAEKPSYTGAIYIDTPIGGTQNRIKMTANADIADKAINDSAGLSIRDTYLSSLGYTDDGKQTILIKGSGNNQTRIALPIASTTKSGIVTTDAQSFGGTKTFTTINSTNLTITGTSGFSYTGIETATGDKARPVWFAYDGINGKPVVNTNFTYNPATQTLKVANLSGTADKAIKDSGGQNIRSTYISSVEADKDNKYKYNFKTPTGAIRNSIIIYDEFQKRSQVDATTDWNTLTSTGIYKVQMSAWGDATKMHSPNGYNKDLYSFGILLVFESIANDSEKRFTQIYIPHNANISISGSAYKRMHNGSDITTDWQGWHPIARGLNWSELTGKPNYAGSNSAGGAATSANKLNTNAGSTTLPVYFSNGVPVACSTNLAVNITGNAASATKLTSNAGSATQPIYFKDGKPVATTYSLNAHVQASSGEDFSTGGWKKMNGNVSGSYITVGYNNNPAIWNSERYSASIVFGKYDTKGLLDCSCDTSVVTFGGASNHNSTDDNPYWYFKLSGTSGQTYTFPVTSKTLAANDGSNASGTWGISITGKSASADALNWVAGNQIRFTKPNYTEPQTLHIAWAWADGSQSNLINDYRFNNGNGYNLAQVTASQFNGNLNGNANTASNLNGINTILSTGIENSEITIKTNNNGIFTLTSNCSLRNAIDFRWYETNWQIGNIRGGSTDSIGFGFAFSSNGGNTFALKSYIDTDGYYHGGVAGNANTATALTSSAGSSTQPIYFSGGKPVACTYTLNKSVPADAKFTDTNTWRPLGTTGDTACAGNDSRLSNARPASDVYAWAKASTKPSYSWGEITGKPSTFTPSSHTHYSLSTIGDQRSTATTPNSYYNAFVFQGIKNNSTIGITDADDYSYVLGLRGWADSTGGDSHELAFNTTLGILTRNGGTTWNAWRRILDSSNYTSYTVTKSGSGASGTWGINVTGNAATATKLQTARTISLTGSVTGSGTFDGSGNLSITTSTNHSHSQYLPLYGGTMDGTSFITWADSGNWNNNNNNVTFPVTRGGLRWFGQSDSVKLFSQETASDNLELVLQFGDDNSNGLSIRNSTDTQTARIDANGNMAAASLRVGNGSGSTINFCTNGSTANPGAKIVAYNDRIEFVFA